MLLSIALLTLLALLLGSICKLIKVPALLGMLLTGIILGPYCLDLLDAKLLGISLEIRQVALVVILLRAGLALDIESLRKVGRPAILMCFIPACFEIVGMIIFAPLILGVSIIDAAIMGAVVAAVSPAVVVPKMLKLIEEGRGTAKSIPQMIMAAGSVDDVFVIVLFTSFITLGAGGEFQASTLAAIPASIAMGLAAGIISGVALVKFFQKVHMRDTVKMIMLLSVSFMLLALEDIMRDILPISALLGVMAMGATVLSQYETLAKRISPKYTKMWVVAEILLFVLVGATVDVSYAISAGAAVLLLLAVVMIWRMAGVYISTIGTPLTQQERLFCLVAYMPKATVQAAIGSIPLGMGLGCGEIVLSVAVVAIMVTAPLGAFGIDLLSERLLSKE